MYVCQRMWYAVPHRALRKKPLRAQCGGMLLPVCDIAFRALLEDSQRAVAGCQRRGTIPRPYCSRSIVQKRIHGDEQDDVAPGSMHAFVRVFTVVRDIERR